MVGSARAGYLGVTEKGFGEGASFETEMTMWGGVHTKHNNSQRIVDGRSRM